MEDAEQRGSARALGPEGWLRVATGASPWETNDDGVESPGGAIEQGARISQSLLRSSDDFFSTASTGLRPWLPSVAPLGPSAERVV